MSDKCENSECREEIITSLTKKVPKYWLWIGFIIIGLPLLITGINVWSGQASDSLRYAPVRDVVDCRIRIGRLEEANQYTQRTLIEIKNDLRDTKTTVLETKSNTAAILKMMVNDKKKLLEANIK